MGRPKIAVIDDSLNQEDSGQAQPKNKKEKKVKKAQKVETVEATEVRSDAENNVILESAAMPESKKDAGQASMTEEKETKKPQKPGKSKPRSKKYQEKTAELDRAQSYPLNDAVAKVKELSYSKFPGTLEIHINTRLSGIRGLVTLPYASGKKLTILAFGKDAADSGADIIGDDAKIEEISKGKIDFDLVVTSPEWMPKLAKVAKNLGPRGLMPSPKNGTISTNLKQAVEGFQAGKTEYKSENKAMLIHLALGKLSQPDGELAANVKTLLSTIGKSRIKKVTLAPTIGPSVKLDLASI